MQLILLIGLPASGKSTFYRERFAHTHRLVSKDLLRNNKRKNRRQMRLLEEAFEAGEPVVLDNTHPSVQARAPWLEWAHSKGWETVGYYLSASLDECKRRNAQRPQQTWVPDVGFFTILRELERPSLKEGFHKLYFVASEGGETVVKEWEEQ